MKQVVKDIIAGATVQHITPQQIADTTGLDRKTVNALFTGENDNPKLLTLEAVAGCLGGEVSFTTPDSNSAVRMSDVSYYRTLISQMKQQIDIKDKWIRYLFLTSLGLIGINVITDVICFFVIKL